MIVISACLLGYAVRYDGSHKLMNALKNIEKKGLAIGICPEVLGGLPTPRTAAEIVKGDGNDVWAGCSQVLTKDNEDVTEAFKIGAQQALQILIAQQITHVILKANSPSCSSQNIYVGKFDGSMSAGVGVTTALLLKNGITVWDENHPELIHWIQDYISRYT